MEITIKIFRYDPEKDVRGHYETYTVEGDENDRVLDVLELVKGKSDGTLAFRRSCAHGVCGSDAMRINGRNMLACKTLVRDVGANITVEPVLGLKVKKDLIVDMDPFFDNYKKMLPYMINESPLPADGRERLQSPEDRARFDESTKCILCAACTTSCPSYWANGEYYGPLPSSPLIASSSTAAMKPLANACRSLQRRTAWRAVTPRTTAPKPARVRSRSPRPSVK
jgi:succinate dehydrogenase / fumarate reductase iron-sulfur subunit